MLAPPSKSLVPNLQSPNHRDWDWLNEGALMQKLVCFTFAVEQSTQERSVVTMHLQMFASVVAKPGLQQHGKHCCIKHRLGYGGVSCDVVEWIELLQLYTGFASRRACLTAFGLDRLACFCNGCVLCERLEK